MIKNERIKNGIKTLVYLVTMAIIIIIFISTAFSHVKTIHVYVTLADNGQGIVSSNESLENGSDLYHNQYWGALFGVKQFLQKSGNWILIHVDSGYDDIYLERLIFRHKRGGAYLIADAYSGKTDQLRATNDTFRALSGKNKDTLEINDPDITGTDIIGIHSNADLIVYMGHHFFGYDGYIDNHNNIDDVTRDVILLACVTNKMCSSIEKANANPLILTKQFMAPEAYTLDNVLEGWLIGEDKDQLKHRAGVAYGKFQKISLKAALGVFTNSCQ